MKTGVAAFLLAAGACAWQGNVQAQQALVLDSWASDDADGSRVAKAGISLDWRHDDDRHYQGLRVEQAWFDPAGGGAERRASAYLRFAGSSAGHPAWRWKGRIGSDGHTWLGSASAVHDGARRLELFLEREVVETPLGLERGIHYTYGGAALDLPLGDDDMTVLLAGVQAFDGGNRRTHLRLRQVHVLSQAHGLSVQLRLRHARDSRPHSYDYYSPRWYARVLPVLQWRRFSGGWQFRVAAGAGRQADADNGWRNARRLEAGVTSPADRPWSFDASLVHTDEPSGASGGGGYRYTQAMFTATRRF